MTADQASRPLFGGAITADITGDWMDASTLRQVPDNQEVLLSASNELTMVVEVLESVKEGAASSDLEAAVRFHFDSLAHDNDASSSDVQQIFALPGSTPGPLTLAAGQQPGPNTQTPSPLCLVGEQQIKKFGQGSGAGDRVRIYLALWRLSPAKDVDLVMSLNEPLSANDLGNAEASARIAGSASASAQQTFTRAVSSLHVHDWGLFAQ